MATPALVGAFTPAGDRSPIPGMFQRKLAASAQIGRGQFATVDPATGYASLNDGATPNMIAAGNGDVSELSDTSGIAGAAAARLSDRFFYGLKMGTTTDGFTDADFCVPFYIKDENTLGKLSNSGGSNRSLGGLVFGLAVDGTPYAWSGPLAHAIARGVAMAQAKVGASYQIATAAGTDTAEVNMVREKYHGVVTGVDFTGLAIATNGTDNVQFTVAKRDGAGGGATTIATYDSNAGGAATAFVPKAFTLSVVAGALNLLETDVVTITVAHGGAGKAITGNIRLTQKVI